MADNELFDRHRLLLFYKGDISALMLFAQQDNGNICFPNALPALSSVMEVDDIRQEKVTLHPSLLLAEINRLLNLDEDILRLETGFSEAVNVPGGTITLHMARFMLLDPPHRLMHSRGCRLRTLPELRGRPPTEMELLRRAYVKVMEA